jgi:hypothetical protein
MTRIYLSYALVELAYLNLVVHRYVKKDGVYMHTGMKHMKIILKEIMPGRVQEGDKIFLSFFG